MAVAVIAACCVLSGCSDAQPNINFTVDEVRLFVGDRRDLAPYAVFDPPTSDIKSFTLKTDGDCIKIDKTAVIAVKPGVATVTARSGAHSDSVKVSVTYAAVQNISISTDGELLQTIGGGKPKQISFSARLDSRADPDTEIEWKVNGAAAHKGASFVFEPKGIGEYTVSAHAKGACDAKTVRVYRGGEAVGSSDGELIQYRDFSPIRFFVRETVDPDDPHSAYDWRVNGASVSANTEYVFTPPSAGEYGIELYVNGVKRKIDGQPLVTVKATGERAPSCRVVFDDLDGPLVTWNSTVSARSVVITPPSGERVVYNKSDSRYSSRFGAGFFDATDIIELCATKPEKYTVAVIADNTGENCVFEQYPSGAEKYIDTPVLCRNSFIEDADGAAEWLQEIFACGVTDTSCYLSHDGAERADDIMTALDSYSDILGINAVINRDGNILTVKIEPYVNSPTVYSSSEVRQLRSEMPHIESSTSRNLRGSKYILAVERRERAVAVTGSEQLLAATMAGFKPEPVAASVAEIVYANARSILLHIIGADYDDTQKVHAIYDWLQFCSRRDESADARNACNYLEGVFGSVKKLSDLVVSDKGAAKAFSLMCGMEGIDCETVCAVGTDSRDYYCRVRLDGLYYNVDVFDGEIGDGTTECCSHAGLFLPVGGDPSVVGSAYDVQKSYYLRKSFAGDTYTDKYLSGRDLTADIKTVIDSAFSASKRVSFDVRLPSGKTVTYFNSDYAAELMFDAAVLKAEEIAIAVRDAAVEYIDKFVRKNYVPSGEGSRTVDAEVKYYTDTIRAVSGGNIVYVTALIPPYGSSSEKWE